MNDILLRAVEPEDVDFILECESDTLNARWSDYRAPFSRNQLLTYALTYDADPFKSGQLRLIIEDGVGRAGILDLFEISEKDSKASVGICIHPSKRNRGIGCKAVERVKGLCRDRLGLSQLVAEVSTQNAAAFSMFTGCGFDKIAILPRWHRIGPDYHDFHLLNFLL